MSTFTQTLATPSTAQRRRTRSMTSTGETHFDLGTGSMATRRASPAPEQEDNRLTDDTDPLRDPFAEANSHLDELGEQTQEELALILEEEEKQTRERACQDTIARIRELRAIRNNNPGAHSTPNLNPKGKAPLYGAHYPRTYFTTPVAGRRTGNPFGGEGGGGGGEPDDDGNGSNNGDGNNGNPSP